MSFPRRLNLAESPWHFRRLAGAIHLETFLKNALHSQRFARYVGESCRSSTIQDVVKEQHLDWHTVKRLKMQLLREQVVKDDKARAQVIRINEISLRKGHEYCCVVSDLKKHQLIRFGRTGCC